MKTLSINNNHFKNILKPQRNNHRPSFGIDFRINSKGDVKALYEALNLQTEKWDKDEVQYYIRKGENKTSLDRVSTRNKKEVKETLYDSFGKRSFIYEYKDGKPYKTTHYDMFSNKIAWVKYEDNSFGLYQQVSKDKTNIEMAKKYGDDIVRINFEAISKPNSIGSLEYSRMNGNNCLSSCKVYWTPSTIINYSGCEADRQEYISMLKEFQRILKSKEYKSDFGHHKNLNNQLNEVIKYLKNK